MLYSKCDINFNAVGKTPATEIAEIVPTGTIESAIMDLRLEMAVDSFFIEHARWEYEGMALEAYKEACGDETVLESNLTVIREADENAGKETMGQKIKNYAAKIAGMITKALGDLAEKLSNTMVGKLIERIKNGAKEKIEAVDFAVRFEKLKLTLKAIDIISKYAHMAKSGKEEVTVEEIKEDIAKQTGGDPAGGMKETLNLAEKDEKTKTFTKEQIIAFVKDFPSKAMALLKDAKNKITTCLKDLYNTIMSHDVKGFRNIGWQIAQLLMVAGGIVVMAVLSVVNKIREAATSIAGAASAAADKAKAWKNTKNIGDGATKDLDKDDIDTTATA